MTRKILGAALLVLLPLTSALASKDDGFGANCSALLDLVAGNPSVVKRLSVSIHRLSKDSELLKGVSPFILKALLEKLGPGSVAWKEATDILADSHRQGVELSLLYPAYKGILSNPRLNEEGIEQAASIFALHRLRSQSDTGTRSSFEWLIIEEFLVHEQCTPRVVQTLRNYIRHLATALEVAKDPNAAAEFRESARRIFTRIARAYETTDANLTAMIHFIVNDLSNAERGANFIQQLIDGGKLTHVDAMSILSGLRMSPELAGSLLQVPGLSESEAAAVLKQALNNPRSSELGSFIEVFYRFNPMSVYQALWIDDNQPLDIEYSIQGFFGGVNIVGTTQQARADSATRPAVLLQLIQSYHIPLPLRQMRILASRIHEAAVNHRDLRVGIFIDAMIMRFSENTRGFDKEILGNLETSLKVMRRNARTERQASELDNRLATIRRLQLLF